MADVQLIVQNPVVGVTVNPAGDVTLTVNPTGIPGLTGPKGDKGDTGATGTPGIVYVGNWGASTTYGLGDAVRFNGSSYVSLQAANTNRNPGTQGAWWGLLAQKGDTGSQGTKGAQWRGAYDPATPYAVDDLVQYAGSVFINVVAGSGQAPQTTASWNLLAQGFNFLGGWGSSRTYQPGDVVFQNGNSYVCNTTVMGKSPAAGNAEWTILVQKGNTGDTGATGPQGAKGLQFRGDWASATAYVVDDVVEINGSAYIATAASTNQNPVTATAFWGQLIRGTNPVGGWNNSTAYKVGDIVSRNNAAYIARVDNTNIAPPNPGTTNATWLMISGPGVVWRGVWSSATAYTIGDGVSRNGSSYIATGNSTNQDPASLVNWALLAAKGDQGNTGNTGPKGDNGNANFFIGPNQPAMVAGQPWVWLQTGLGTNGDDQTMNYFDGVL